MKHLNRIIAPRDLGLGKKEGMEDNSKVAEVLHDHTYGITSDPLTQFACVFSALIQYVHFSCFLFTPVLTTIPMP